MSRLPTPKRDWPDEASFICPVCGEQELVRQPCLARRVLMHIMDKACDDMDKEP